MNKYGAIKTECAQAHVHDSRIEAGKCNDLAAQERAGLITHLVQQPEFPVEVNGRRCFVYRADFGYRMADSGLPIVLDVKGMRTPVFMLKKKIVEAAYPGFVITIWPPIKRKTRKKKVKD